VDPSTGPSLAERARRHAALAEPMRLAIVEGLLTGDLAPDEIARDLGVSSNLLAHHLATLEGAGLVRRSPSHGDRRRRYVQLASGALDGLLRPPRFVAASLLFVCTANSARSQLAAAIWRRHSPVPASSAGRRPAPCIAEGAAATARRHGLQLTDAPRGYDEVDRPPGLVVSVCDLAREAELPFQAPRLHWSIADPVVDGSPEAFEATYAELERRIGALAVQVDAAGRCGSAGNVDQP
jgi:ArsR family transcriptional regulator, arsenate/arsenite/antimonite-responsive transcriptional repressor / arsenate reductase (thioredoxin)